MARDTNEQARVTRRALTRARVCAQTSKLYNSIRRACSRESGTVCGKRHCVVGEWASICATAPHQPPGTSRQASSLGLWPQVRAAGTGAAAGAGGTRGQGEPLQGAQARVSVAGPWSETARPEDCPPQPHGRDWRRQLRRVNVNVHRAQYTPLQVHFTRREASVQLSMVNGWLAGWVRVPSGARASGWANRPGRYVPALAPPRASRALSPSVGPLQAPSRHSGTGQNLCHTTRRLLEGIACRLLSRSTFFSLPPPAPTFRPSKHLPFSLHHPTARSTAHTTTTRASSCTRTAANQTAFGLLTPPKSQSALPASRARTKHVLAHPVPSHRPDPTPLKTTPPECRVLVSCFPGRNQTLRYPRRPLLFMYQHDRLNVYSRPLKLQLFRIPRKPCSPYFSSDG